LAAKLAVLWNRERRRPRYAEAFGAAWPVICARRCADLSQRMDRSTVIRFRRCDFHLSRKRLTRLRAQRDLLSRINLMLAVQSCLKKYFLSRLTQITFITRAVLSHRGAYRDRHGRGAGCGGRGSVGRARRWQGRLRPVSDQGRADERCSSRTAKSCGPDAPTLASSWRVSADDGDKKARSPGRARSNR
jgi:hypothetical protein